MGGDSTRPCILSSVHSSCIPIRGDPVGSIVLNTEIPGPRSRELTARKDSTIARAKGLWMPMWIDHGRGALLHDVDGNTFIDFAGGIGCLNIGHAHPRVVKAVQDAAAKFLHTDFTVVPVRVVRRPRRAAAAAGADRRPQARGVLQLGRRGGGERDQDREGRHRPARRDRVRGGVPRPHAHGDVADLEGASVQGRLRPVRARGLPRAVPERLHARPRRRRRSRWTTCAGH